MGLWIRRDSSLDSRLRELAILQVGCHTDTAYEWAHHIRLACRDYGVTEDDVRAVMAESRGEVSGLGELERAVLQAAREMTDDLRASDDVFGVLQRELSEEHLIDLFMTIAYYNLVIRLLHTLEIDLEEDYEGLLKDFPIS